MAARKKSTNKPPEPQHYSKHWFILFFIAVLILALLVIRPFIASLLIGAVIAYVLHPVYRKINNKIHHKGLAAGTVVALMLLVLMIPFAFFTAHITKESYVLYQSAKDFYNNETGQGTCDEQTSLLCETYTAASNFTKARGIDLTGEIASASTSVITMILKSITSFVIYLPSLILNIFITIFIIFYLLIDGEMLVERLKTALPIKREHSDSIFKQFNDVIYATIYGSVILAIIQGILAFIGFTIFGAPSPLILGLLTILFAFVPFVGTAIVWAPASIMMMMSGTAAADSNLALRGFGLLIYGMIIISMSDNLLRPKIVGDKANIHPLIILLGVFGGIAVFGFAGIIIGPLALTLFVTALRIYEKEKEYVLKD